jgi:hypothetical protein
MKNSKSCGKQEVDVREIWKGETRYKSPCKSHISNTKSFLPVEAEISAASTGRNDFIFDIWLLHGDLYHVSPFQVYRTSTSCLQCDLEFFMFAVVKIL